jgi:hypothetical protein
MTNPGDPSRADIDHLFDSGEDQLFEELGIRLQAITEDPAVAGTFTPDVTYDVTTMGPLDTIRSVGKRLFARWEREAYSFVCGEHDADRETLVKALSIDAKTAGAVLAGMLVANLGIAPALAAVVATILMKRFFAPTVQELCSIWKERLQPSGAA